MVRTAKTVSVLLLLLSGASSALVAFVSPVDVIASTSFNGNLCAIPTATELSNAGVTTACHKLRVLNGTARNPGTGTRVPAYIYGAVWATFGQKSQLQVRVRKLAGTRKQQAAFERFFLAGAFTFEPHVNVGRHADTLQFGTQLESTWGHLYEGQVFLNTPTQPASYANEASATAATTAIGRSIVAALK
jgi:hypothetical protein